MAVYVDDMKAPYGRMIMCHMIADHEDELHAMAARIGVARKWYQGDHYDIALSKRARAIFEGAVPITMRQAGLMIAVQKRTGVMPLPQDALRIWREMREQEQRERHGGLLGISRP